MARSALKNIHLLIQAAKEELPPNESFVADLKASIEKEAEKNQRKPSQSYKPSSMNCTRNMYFQVIGAKQDISKASSGLVGIVESGSARHDHLQSAIIKMKNYGMSCEYVDVAKFIKSRGLDYLSIKAQRGHETHLLHKNLNISFMCDGIIKYKGQYYILEIKTETMYKWQSRKEVAEEHITQGTAYSVCLGIDQVMFLYENRDTCDKKAYILDITEGMKYGLVIGKIEECENYVKELKVPPKPKGMTAKTCQYCMYLTECRKAGK